MNKKEMYEYLREQKKMYSNPFMVRITYDCRDGIKEYEKLDGEYGVCLGLYDYPDVTKKSEDVMVGNPLIVTEAKDYVWGIECWWYPLTEENYNDDLEIHREAARLSGEAANEMLERVLNKIGHA